MKALLAALLVTATVPAVAQQMPVPAAPAPSPAAKAPPKLLVVISVDQFSADLFAQYRDKFTDGFARLLQGAVFPSGYQSHAATETCPGHSTILTGVHPATSGIIANTWLDQKVGRADKLVYCAEDERVPGSNHDDYTPSDLHLKVPTLGDLMKRANPASRVVSVAGKDRAAIMMGGHNTDQIWFWNGKTVATLAGRPANPVADRTNQAVAALIAQPQTALPVPGYCARLMQGIAIGSQTLGAGRFERAAGDAKAFRASPALDGAVFAMAAGFIQDMKLGQGAATDLIAIGASATDYVGHAYGPGGGEMCVQLAQLDATIGAFFATLDGWNIDYEVVLTADHGGHDATERQQTRAMPMETRVSTDVSAKAVGAAIGKTLGIAGPVLLSSDGDLYVSNDVPAAKRDAVIAETVRRFKAMPQIAAALTAKEIAATPMPHTPPETWTLTERARASFYPGRSGDVLLLLKPRVTGIPTPGPGYVATHGSPWDYDRRVPILFWRKGMAGFEQPLSVETIDIAPTLAATIGLPVTGMEGRCLDLDGGSGDSCR
ncbi:alkaline phosphatase family protein [Sphingomonas sp. SUN019]|uniref:alkaline phosphatase family protein n=1 Tax=Sphingomonas sp. SUN019 TaxID=2937788 RepID=UPI0021642373|nr:alkaline phosphatase family protein [Sphingomonas sp. SUN019]UVO51921.1 alkaline phosphatase family protein [Sphingomonas sp. SUN019]